MIRDKNADVIKAIRKHQCCDELTPDSMIALVESMTEEEKESLREALGVDSGGSDSGGDTWISLLPHLTATIPEDLSTIDPENGGEPIVLYEFTSEEDSLTNEPYAYINVCVYPAIFVNDYLLRYDSDEDVYKCRVPNGILFVSGTGAEVVLVAQSAGGGGII